MYSSNFVFLRRGREPDGPVEGFDREEFKQKLLEIGLTSERFC